MKMKILILKQLFSKPFTGFTPFTVSVDLPRNLAHRFFKLGVFLPSLENKVLLIHEKVLLLNVTYPTIYSR
jgi:hypothetical protein